jgi:hypothetical protein
MTTIIAPHQADPKKLADVVTEMSTLGSPSIAAYWDGEKYIALEGSHRIAAAAQLGLPVAIVEYDGDDEIEHDFDDVTGTTVAAVLEYLAEPPVGTDYSVEVIEAWDAAVHAEELRVKAEVLPGKKEGE